MKKAAKNSGINRTNSGLDRLNNGLNRFKFVHYEMQFSNANVYTTIDPPAPGYKPASASAYYDDNRIKVTGVSWQLDNNKAVIWFDNYLNSLVRFDVLWIKNYD